MLSRQATCGHQAGVGREGGGGTPGPTNRCPNNGPNHFPSANFIFCHFKNRVCGVWGKGKSRLKWLSAILMHAHGPPQH